MMPEPEFTYDAQFDAEVDADRCSLFVGDCIEVLRREVADNSVQLTITSPPYDNLRRYNGFTWDFEGVAAELYRVTKLGGIVVWVVADATVNGSETGTSFRQALHFKSIGFNLHDTMIWNKPNPNPRQCGPRYKQAHEYMFVLSKGNITTFNPIREACKLAGQHCTGTQRENHIEHVLVKQNRICRDTKIIGNVWTVAPQGMGLHVACFPERLVLNHILSWSNPNDLILDPFLGSGTTGKIAVLNKRRFIGCDVSSTYVDSAARRIAQARQIYE